MISIKIGEEEEIEKPRRHSLVKRVEPIEKTKTEAPITCK